MITVQYYRMLQGSTDDDLGTNSDLSDNTLDLAALTRSDSSHLNQLSGGGANGKGRVSSTGNLSESSRWGRTSQIPIPEDGGLTQALAHVDDYKINELDIHFIVCDYL